MATKKPISKNTTAPLSPEDQVKAAYTDIADHEDAAATKYWRCGDALVLLLKEKQDAKPDYGWKELVAYCVDRLHLNRSRIVRAWRIRKNYSSVKDLDGLSLYSALAHEPKETTRQPQPVGSEWTGYEYHAVARYVRAVGGEYDENDEKGENAKKRAVEVLARFVRGDKKPVKPTKAASGWQATWEKVRDNRDRLRKRSGDLNAVYEAIPEADRALPSYMDVKANPTAALERFHRILWRCEREVAARHQATASSLLSDMARISDKPETLADMAKVAGEAAQALEGMVQRETAAEATIAEATAAAVTESKG
jgi:hypothetical protein